MLCTEIMAVCSEIHTKHINTLCGQNVELLNVKLAVHIMTTGLQRSTVLPNTSKQLHTYVPLSPLTPLRSRQSTDEENSKNCRRTSQYSMNVKTSGKNYRGDGAVVLCSYPGGEVCIIPVLASDTRSLLSI